MNIIYLFYCFMLLFLIGSEEEYIAWENKVNSEFVEFLAHIREWVSGKEGQLKEQQLDLCHRERSLQSNEDFFKVSCSRSWVG